MINRSKELTVVYVCIDSTLGGSTLSLLSLIESVNEQVYPVVLFPKKDVAYSLFVEHGIESYFYPFINLFSFKQNRMADDWLHPWRWSLIKKMRSDLGCAFFLKKQLKGRRVDIVHSNTSASDVGVCLSQFLRAKHVWHVRECLDDHAQWTMYGGMARLVRMINKADARIAISSYVRKHWRMVDRNTFMFHDAICSMRDVSCRSRKDRYVLFVSYVLTEEKGSRTAVKAFGLSGLYEEGYKLVMMGNCSSDFQLSLMTTAKEFHCEQGMVFLPCQGDVKPFYEKASVLIMASKFEGLGRVTAEAMFYGCPVVAHASGGTLDLVQDGKTGYLFKNLDDCAGLLRRVCLEDQEAIIHQAQRFAVEHLSTETYGSRILSVYHSIQ